MKLTVVKFLFLFCAISANSASPIPGIPDIDLYGPMLKTIDGACRLFQHVPKLDILFSPRISNIFFELRTDCTRKQYGMSETIKMVESPEFDVNRKTVVFVSGWNTHMDLDYITELTKAYLCRGADNFIVVNTSYFIRGLYIKSAYNTGEIGEFIAVGLKNMQIPGKNIHLIGHSLGAHIVGSAGRHFTTLTGDKIGRITGLDPARPCFVDGAIIPLKPVYARLGKDDASFVDIIHSNSNEAGLEKAIGHVDFYPGGLMSTQPACNIADILCSHVVSIKYYAETVYKGNERNFIATQCENDETVDSTKCRGSQTHMGYDVDENARGVYVLGVMDAAPYGRSAKRGSNRKSEKCGICKK